MKKTCVVNDLNDKCEYALYHCYGLNGKPYCDYDYEGRIWDNEDFNDDNIPYESYCVKKYIRNEDKEIISTKEILCDTCEELLNNYKNSKVDKSLKITQMLEDLMGRLDRIEKDILEVKNQIGIYKKS